MSDRFIADYLAAAGPAALDSVGAYQLEDSLQFAEPIDPSGSWMLVWREALQICATCHSLAPSNPLISERDMNS